MNDPFCILNIPETANDNDIRKAYLKLVKQFPPEQAPEQFKRIRSAYDCIKNERSRLSYRLFHTPSLSFEQWLDHAFELPEDLQLSVMDMHDLFDNVVDDNIFSLPEKTK